LSVRGLLYTDNLSVVNSSSENKANQLLDRFVQTAFLGVNFLLYLNIILLHPQSLTLNQHLLHSKFRLCFSKRNLGCLSVYLYIFPTEYFEVFEKQVEDIRGIFEELPKHFSNNPQ